MLSHDLRNHIATLGLMTGVLGRLLADRGDQTGLPHLALINDVVAAMDELTQAVLDVGLIETGQLRIHPEPLSLSSALPMWAQRHEPQAEQGGVELVIDLEDGVPLVYADGARIAQVVAIS